jgi:hypothetical protein
MQSGMRYTMTCTDCTSVNSIREVLYDILLSTYLSVLRPQKEVPWMVVVMALDASLSLATVLVLTSPACLSQPALSACH